MTQNARMFPEGKLILLMGDFFKTKLKNLLKQQKCTFANDFFKFQYTIRL